MLKLMYITNDPRVAQIASAAGANRIFLDMEVLGKAQRQGHLDSVKSFHTFEDIRRVRAAVDCELLVRVNPIHEGSEAEIDRAVLCGADVIMLPMWKSAGEVERFIRFVGGRAKTMPLLETKEADAALQEVLRLPGVDEIHIGLNDLHLSYGKKFLFELLADGTVERLCGQIRQSGIPYGFGGVGRPGGGLLPAEYILGEHYRLGSEIVILSRSFCNTSLVTDYGEIERTFREGVAEIRAWEARFATWTQEDFLENQRRVQRCVAGILRQKES